MAEAAVRDPQQQEQEFVPTAEQLRPHGAFVTQVYQNEIGGFCTPAKERLLMEQHLKKTGVLLRYSWEIGENETAWTRRLHKHLKANPHGPRARTRMPKEMARKALVKMERTYAHRMISPKKADKREDEDFRHMNELRAIIGLEAWNYREKGVPEASKEAQAIYEEIQEIAEPDARMAAVRTVNFPDVLRLVMLNDSYAAVRELAEKRYGEMMVVRR